MVVSSWPLTVPRKAIRSGAAARPTTGPAGGDSALLVEVHESVAAPDALDPDRLVPGQATVLVLGRDEHDRVQGSLVAVSRTVEVSVHDDRVVVGEHRPRSLRPVATNRERTNELLRVPAHGLSRLDPGQGTRGDVSQDVERSTRFHNARHRIERATTGDEDLGIRKSAHARRIEVERTLRTLAMGRGQWR